MFRAAAPLPATPWTRTLSMHERRSAANGGAGRPRFAPANRPPAPGDDMSTSPSQRPLRSFARSFLGSLGDLAAAAAFAGLLSLTALVPAIPGPIGSAGLAAQEDPEATAGALADWVALPAPPGHEELATDRLLRRLEGWERDSGGNLVRERGSGTPARVVACGIDRPGYAVSQITGDGYLRLHTVGRTPGHPLWHGFHQGQPVEVHTAEGPVPAVTAIPNAHFANWHRGDTVPVTADELWVDAGAASRQEAGDLGIRLLDPVARRLPAWSYGGLAAGPAAGARAGCAAVAAVAGAGSDPASGRTVFLITTQRTLGWVGLGGALARMGEVASLTLVGTGREAAEDATVPAERFGGLTPVLEAAGLDSVRRISPRVLYPGTLVESVEADAAAGLRERVAEAAGMPEATTAPWPEVGGTEASGREVSAETDRAALAAAAAGTDGIEPLASLLGGLTDLPGVSGHEEHVREAVLAALPDWARRRAEVDTAGNVTVTFGPDRDTTVFLAHLDEVGWAVESVAGDGTVSLDDRGGFFARAWEGQPAVLHPSEGDEPIRGVFVPREEAERRSVGEMRARFGLDSAALAGRGVRPGDQVLGHKEALRLGPARLAARSEDDRAGTAALLVALHRIDPERVPRKVVFAWTVREEIGLEGAAVLAGRLGRSTTRVYSVDTFVSSDTPLESPHFAHAPLGEGPVLRAAESSSLATRPARERVEAVAREAGIPLQVGLTQGGTDGTTFTFRGAPNAGLSWPGRYSHSPVEVLDLRDVSLLVDLIRAVATR